MILAALLILSAVIALCSMVLSAVIYFSAICKFAELPKQAFFEDCDYWASYLGVGAFELASTPSFNRMLFDKKYESHVGGERVRLVLDSASKGYRGMVISFVIFAISFMTGFFV